MIDRFKTVFEGKVVAPYTTDTIGYTKGYKYQSSYDYRCKTEIRAPQRLETKFIELRPDGWLFIKAGYAWDGPSGPTIDTKNFMRGSKEHDAFYQLMRLNLLSPKWRKAADKRLYNICRADGMSRFRAWYVLYCVRKGAGYAADPKNRKKIIYAPK